MSDFSDEHTKVHEICPHCRTSHSEKMLCHASREALDVSKSCDFCGIRHSNLNTHFAEHEMAHLHNCLDKIYESEQRHICEQKVKSMVVKKDPKICGACVAHAIPTKISHETVADVECMRFLHHLRICPKFCFYCFYNVDEDSDNNFKEHRCYECPLSVYEKRYAEDGF